MSDSGKMKQRDVWNSIAGPWKEYRKRMFREVADFLRRRKGLTLDIACGSGRHFGEGRVVGTDFSMRMLELAREQAKERGIDALLAAADARRLPFRDETFDNAVFAAALQCMEHGRDEALREARRVLKTGGEMIVTVWNYDQPRFRGAKQGLIPWKHDGREYQRYYYLYEKDELENELKKAGFSVASIRGSESKVHKVFPRNIIAVVRK